MRIAMIFSTPIPPREGIGFYVWNLSRNLSNLGHKVHMITRGSYHHLSPQGLGDITVWRPIYIPIYPFHVYFHNIFVNLFIRMLDPEVDIYHLHSPLVGIPKTNKPLIVTVHTTQRANSSFTKINDLHSLLVKLQIPVSIRIENQLFNQAARLISVSSSVSAELREYGINPERVAILGNGVDPDIFTYKKSKNFNHSDFILSAGRLDYRKGFDDLIYSAQIVVQKYPHILFLVAGEGPRRGILQALINKLHLQNHVRLLGHVSQNELVDLYQSAKCFVLPSHYEGLPTVLLEAMSCGCPVIATSVSGALDVVQDRVNGLMVPIQDSPRLAAAIDLVLADQCFSTSISQAARKTVEECFSWSKIADSYLNQYKLLFRI